jgi:hypothetical protein
MKTESRVRGNRSRSKPGHTRRWRASRPRCDIISRLSSWARSRQISRAFTHGWTARLGHRFLSDSRCAKPRSTLPVTTSGAGRPIAACLKFSAARGKDRSSSAGPFNPPRSPKRRASSRSPPGGYDSFNIKIGYPQTPQYDLQLVQTVCNFAPGGFHWADANTSYDVETALAMAPKLADAGLRGLESPLPPNLMRGYQALERQGALPILMDEGIISPVEVDEFIALKMLDGIAMKVARCGGLWNASRIVALLRGNNLLVFGSGLTRSGSVTGGYRASFRMGRIRYPDRPQRATVHRRAGHDRSGIPRQWRRDPGPDRARARHYCRCPRGEIAEHRGTGLDGRVAASEALIGYPAA